MSAYITLDRLEPRTLLSSISDNILRIEGTDGNDHIEIDGGDDVTVTINGNVENFRSDSFQLINLYCLDGHDVVMVSQSVSHPAILSGGDGDDTLTGGRGNDLIDGGRGYDMLSYASRNTSIHSPYAFAAVSEIYGDGGETDAFTSVEKLVGGQGNDSLDFQGFYELDGQGGDDVLTLHDGDAIYGGAGNDIIWLNKGAAFIPINDHSADTNIPPLSEAANIYGDAGDDLFIASLGRNTYHGGEGIDRIDYNQMIVNPWFWQEYRWFQDYATIAPVQVTLDGVANDGHWGTDNVLADIEQVSGTPAADQLTAHQGPTTLLGNDGDDALSGDDNDSLDGGAGNNTIIVAPPVSPAPQVQISLSDKKLRIVGTSLGDQILVRRSASDSRRFEVLADGAVVGRYLFSRMNSIQIQSGGGADRIRFDDSLGQARFKTSITAGAGNDTVIGSANADSIHGGAGKDSIRGGGGNDNLWGDAGNDRLFGDAGSDRIRSGAGIDLCRGCAGVDQIIATLGLDNLRDNKGDRLINLVE